MSIRPEVIPFVMGAVVGGLAISCVWYWRSKKLLRSLCIGDGAALFMIGYFLFFFRDPTRIPPGDPLAILAGADGQVASVTELQQHEFRRLAAFSGLEGKDLDPFVEGDTVRISIFLSLFDVHVNRSPIEGEARFLGYFPGAHFFTFHEKSSEHNQHNSILIQSERTVCLVNQIVGPVARRVVYWHDHQGVTRIRAGDRIGMMKFGSRLDMYLPKAGVTVLVRRGDRVRAGESVVARMEEE